MSVASLHLDKALTGTSSDTKPTSIAQGTLFFETDTGAWFVYDGSAWTAFTGPGKPTGTMVREQFLASLLPTLGDTRILWTPKPTDTTTSTGESLNAGSIAWDATVAARVHPLGMGYYQSFDGSTQYGAINDSDIYSFGNGTTDSAFSGIALVKVTDTAASRSMVSKYRNSNTVGREWRLDINSVDKLVLELFDESGDFAPNRTSGSAITQGSWQLFGFSYSAATGGATAASDITLFANGLTLSSAGTENASYVAMENLAAKVYIGSWDNTTLPTSPFSGDMALIGICQKNLSTSDHWAIKKLVNGYFGLSL